MKLILCLLMALPLFAQQQQLNYLATATTTALTIQQPASSAKFVAFRSVSVYCASAATATLSWNGTAATSTTLGTKPVPGNATASTATAWSGSNVGSGTTGPVYNVPAAGTFVIDLGLLSMVGAGTSTNVTIATSGSCTITFVWTEI